MTLRRHIGIGMLIASASVFAATAPASGSCMFPQIVVSPAAGATLPPNPSLYVFVPAFTAATPPLTVEADDRAVPFTLTEVSKASSLSAYRLDVTADAGTSIVVRVQNPDWGDHVTEHDFTVAGSAPMSRGPLTVRSIDTEISRWTCSYQQSQNIRLSSAAAAYRVEWAATERLFDAGATTTLVLPATMGRFFDPEDRTVHTEAVLELGHVNCFGHTLAWGGTGPLYVGITALHTDGSTETLANGPLELYPPERPLLTKLMEDHIGPLMYRVNAYLSTKTGWRFW